MSAGGYKTRRWLKARVAYLQERNYKLSMAKQPESYELTLLKRYEKALDKLWATHSKPVTHKHPGDYDYAQEWWCPTCHRQWPCEIANVVLQAHGSHKLGPLRAPIVGETIVPEGVEPTPGSWMRVQGLIVPKTKDKR